MEPSSVSPVPTDTPYTAEVNSGFHHRSDFSIDLEV